MDTNDDGAFRPPRPEAPPLAGPPLLPPPAPAAPAASFAPPPLFVPRADAPTATVVASSRPPRRGRGKVVGGIVAVAALLGAGGFAVTKIVAGNDGGAASPAEVGTKLMDSLAAEDALGVVDLLLPGERDMLRQRLIDIVDNLKRLEVVDGTASLDKVGGLDLQVSNVHVEQTDTNVGDVADIHITARGTASVDGTTVPIGNLLIDEAFGGKRPDLGSDAQDSDIDWKLATVKHDGRWYLSAFYSIAESVRGNSDDIPLQPIAAQGANSPDGAVQAVFDAVDDLDLESLLGVLNPNEAGALQRYAPLFIDKAQSSLDNVDANIKFSDTKFTVIGTGDRRTVTIDGFTMTAAFNGTDVKVVTKNGCTVMTSGDTTTDTCKAGSSIDEAITALGLDDNGDVKSLVKTVHDAFADMKPVGITVQKVDGQWFVSPVGSFFDLLLAEMQALDKGELTDIIDGAKKVAESVASGGIFGTGGIGGIAGIGGSGDTGSGGSSGASGFDACFSETEFDAFSSCVTAGIDDGSIDPAVVPPYFRFSDCGVGDAYWNGDVYSMSDSEFTHFATQAAPCFQQHVDEGSISDVELPYELSHPECLEGKNWYNVNDTDYTTRVADCAS